MRHHIPNIITLCNLLCGCMALVALFSKNLDLVCWWLAGSFVADALDGLVARSLGVSSPLGAQLDSLADMVSFGVVPGAIFANLLLLADGAPKSAPDLFLSAFPGFVLTAFAAYRLGKFNIDTRQKDEFLGLATPACTVFTAGLLLIYLHNTGGFGKTMLNPVFLYSLLVIFSFLMVSEIPMFNFRFKGLVWVGNEFRIVFLASLMPLFIFTKEGFFSLSVLLYIALSIVQSFFKKIFIQQNSNSNSR